MGSCRCKMCGGHILYDDKASIAVCEYCGTEQTVFRADNEKQLKLFNRANALRMQNEFDKAQLTYDNILIDDPSNAEAHWGICLCRYGIEYIDSPSTGKKIPTCHRTAIKSIFDDLDYKEAIDNADVVAKQYYEKESKVIDKLQKEILSISQKEEPYDIFISYKENDENGNRTKDSMMGEIIYNGLTNKGYRVFYSKIALKGKETTEFEPIIFAALRSAKIMIPIGSKTEYFNSTWEKNEWSRFLNFMQDDSKKFLIPCYFDMESYDMPDEFLVFESIDLNDSDYLDQIVNRIDKKINVKVKETAKESPNQSYNNQINNLIERVKYCLSEKDFAKADEVIENILNLNYKCPEAYFYKVFTKLKLCSIDELVQHKVRLADQKEYQTALSFAVGSSKERLINVSKTVDESIERRRKDFLYNSFFQNVAVRNYKQAFDSARKIEGYRDIDKKVVELKEQIYTDGVNYQNDRIILKAIECYELIYGYKDSIARLKELRTIRHNDAEKQKIASLLNILDDTIERYKSKKLYGDDARVYLNSLNELKYLIKDKDGWYEKVAYYDSMLTKVTKSKTYDDYQYDKEQRRKFIIVLLGVIGVILYLCFLIVPLVVYICRGNSSGAGVWVLVDTITIVVTIIVGYYIADRL